MIIEGRALCKDYVINRHGKGMAGMVKSLLHSERETVRAVSGVDIAIEPGELIGYIGPNGAGKSTTIKMLTGILRPTSGSVCVCGIDPAKDRITNSLNVGAVFGQKSQLWWDLPLRDTFELLAKMYCVPRERYRANLAEFSDYLGIESFINQPVRQLSLGQRMRAEIAAALLHDPKVLFLDEPTIGLDVAVKQAVRDYVHRINAERGVTVLLTTHDLQDIERLARRIIVINKGEVAFDGPLETLSARYEGRRSIHLTLADDAAIQLPEAMRDMAIFKQDGRSVRIEHGADISAADIIAAVMRQADIADMDIRGPQIEDVVMEVYRQ